MQSVVLFKSLTYFSSRIQIFASRKYDLRYLCDEYSRFIAMRFTRYRSSITVQTFGTVILLLVYIAILSQTFSNKLDGLSKLFLAEKQEKFV